MRIATLRVKCPNSQSEARDGILAVVSSDGSLIASGLDPSFKTLQSALDDWTSARPYLEHVAQELEARRWKNTLKADSQSFMAPLPRAYAFLDGSAFIEHVILARKARGAEPPEDLLTVPLMYQGGSDCFLGPRDDIALGNPAAGLDFEGEVAVILGDVPLGVKSEEALKYVRLLVLLNDISLRNEIPREMKTGFGFLHSKPPSSFGPFAVTPDELGTAWSGGRVHLNITCRLNGATVGAPHAGEMHFSFCELISHAAKTRPLSSGTVLGSGTISNADARVGCACLVERRMREVINTGQAQTDYLKAEDVIEIEMLHGSRSLFGKIAQRVTPAL